MARSQNMGISAAFTLLELLVVIGIIALLLAVVLPAANRLINNQKRNNTYANMQIIGNAIGSFEAAKTLGSPRVYSGKLPPDYFLWQPYNATPSPWFEAFLPTDDANDNGIWDPGEHVSYSDQSDPNDEGHKRFCHLIIWNEFPNIAQTDGLQRRMSQTYSAVMDPPYNSSILENYRSIESLYLYMTRLCPECQQQLARLPHSIVTNADVCSSGPCPDKVIFGVKPGISPTQADLVNGEQVDLMELRDAWGKPMRYQVEPTGYLTDSSGKSHPNAWRWELRSAGLDGVFAKDLSFDPNNYSGMFLPEDKSGDDVILSPR